MDLVEAAEFHRHTLDRLNRSVHTIRLYAIYENSFVAFLRESDLEPTLDALSPQLIREWQSWLRGKSTGRRGGVVTEKQGCAIMKTWSRFLWENDIYPFDPLARLKIPRVQRIQRKPFTQEETVRLVQAASAGPNPIRDRALLLLLLDTGARIGETCNATIDDVDMAAGAITFTRTKNGRPRTVRFVVQGRRDGGSCLSALKNWLKVREARDGVNNLFTTRERWPLSPRRAREIFGELGERARVPNAHPHRCRNTAASEYLTEQPGAELALQARLGHVSREVLSTYVSQTDRGIANAADTASLSTKWNLGSGRAPQPPKRELPAPRAAQPAPADARVKCPYCAEDIAAAARKCKHCNEWIDEAGRSVA
jgi:integrase